MKSKPRQPLVPRTAQETVRHSIIALLSEGEFSAKEISMAVGIAEKEVYKHLEHIRRSLQAAGGTLQATPARCRMCDFVFSKRERLTPPGKCPICRKEAIADPRFRIWPPRAGEVSR
jgi:transcriptional regulator